MGWGQRVKLVLQKTNYYKSYPFGLGAATALDNQAVYENKTLIFPSA